MSRAPTPRAPMPRAVSIALMTAIVVVALLGVLVPAASAAPAAPHFGPNVQVDRPPAYTAAAPSLKVGSDGVAYLAFAGWGGSTTQSDIFFTKSLDGGQTWTTPVRVNNDAGGAYQAEPTLALDTANRIYVVWTDPRNGNNDVFFAKSTDGGLSFSANVRVNDVTTNAQYEPDVAVDPVNPSLVHTAWTDTRSAVTGPDIFYANSTDGGLSFNPSIRVNNDATASEQGEPAIATAPNRDVYLVWSDPRTGARGRDIYFSKSSDRGAGWAPNIPVNDDSGGAAQGEPTIATDVAGMIYIAWTDNRNLNTAPDIYATRSSNGGSSFAANVKVNDESGAVTQMIPNIAAYAGKVQVAWTDSRTVGSTSWDIYTSSSLDGLAWSPNVRVNDDPVSNIFQYQPSVAIDPAGDVFAAWLDTRTSGQDVFAATLDVVAPSADAGSAMTVDQGSPASFNGSGSSDNLGIASYAWDFGDGSRATGVAASHTYVVAGGHTATLTVWDDSGNSATSTVQVTVQDTQAPVVRGAGDRLVDEGQPLFFDGSASTDNVGVTSYAWDFGDGTTATTATTNHVYARPGSYAATLTVTDAAGNSAKMSFTVTVQSSALLGMILLLEGIIIFLAIALAFLAWMVWGMRKRDQRRPMPPMSPMTPVPPPAAPPAQPPREPDPLDMPLPGTLPKQP